MAASRATSPCLDPKSVSENTYCSQLARVFEALPTALPTIMYTYTADGRPYGGAIEKSMAIVLDKTFLGANVLRRFDAHVCLVRFGYPQDSMSSIFETHWLVLARESSKGAMQHDVASWSSVSCSGVVQWTQQTTFTGQFRSRVRWDLPLNSDDIVPPIRLLNKNVCTRLFHMPLQTAQNVKTINESLDIERPFVPWSFGVDVPRAIQQHLSLVEAITSSLVQECCLLPPLGKMIVSYITPSLDAHQLHLALHHHGPRETLVTSSQ